MVSSLINEAVSALRTEDGLTVILPGPPKRRLVWLNALTIDNIRGASKAIHQRFVKIWVIFTNFYDSKNSSMIWEA